MRRLLRFGCLLAILAPLFAQPGIPNGDFETGAPGTLPAPWFVPTAFQHFQVSWTSEGCRQGKGCVDLTPGPASGNNPGNIMQMFDATPYRGKLIRYRAAVNVASGARAGLWLRIDRPNGQMGFFDNMSSRPITTAGRWEYFEIDGFVHADAQMVALGVLAYGGTFRFDDASLTITGDLPPPAEEPARALSDSGLRNLIAFTRLFGIVRHFHPSDEAAAADWNRFAIEGVRKIESAATPAQLAAGLQSVFEPVAPTIRVYAGAEPKPHPALSPSGELEVIRWRNQGFGQDTPASRAAYKSERVKGPRDSWKPEDIYTLDLGEGVKAAVPLALFTDEKGTLPHPAQPIQQAAPIPLAVMSANDRATRIADVAIAWNILKHFYPYFDVVKTDWDGVLPVALKEAASDKDGAEFHLTLRRMIAALNDGHGNVAYAGMQQQGRPPILAAWIENKYIVTAASASVAGQVKPGDEIVAIDGKPSAAVLEDLEKLTSAATPQWKRVRSASYALLAGYREKIVLTVRPFNALETKEVTLTCDSTETLPADPRPKSVVTELELGIWYVDLTRAHDADFESALPKLAAAKGIVFDMRGYPSVSSAWFSYVSKTPLKSPQWHVPLIERPGEMSFVRGAEWNLLPKAPFLAAKRVFLANGGDISYAESTMGIVEYYKLGEIVGETTAGTNGNVNPFELPGGYSVTWTGMKVLKQDGSQHHGVGIHPTVPASPTQAGVAAGRDEVLERGVALLKQP